jgi:hypothetical protein
MECYSGNHSLRSKCEIQRPESEGEEECRLLMLGRRVNERLNHSLALIPEFDDGELTVNLEAGIFSKNEE